MRRILCLLGLAAAFVFAAQPAVAGPILTITDNDASEAISITGTGFDLSALVVTVDPSNPEKRTFTGLWLSTVPALTTASKTYYLVEPGGVTNQLVSDYLILTLRYTGNAGRVDGTFESDNPSGPGFIVNPPAAVGDPSTVAEVFGDTILDFTVNVASDTVDVPEPGTMTLLGLGIAGMAGYRWRNRRHAKAIAG